jgi:chromosome partitioning protein
MTSPIIAVASMKGGSGKSTVASCLAVYWHLAGRRPVLIDADPQQSIMRIASRERVLGGLPVISGATDAAAETARQRARNGELVIIDTPGFRSKTTLACVAEADFVLVPLKASPFDIDRMFDILPFLTDRGTRSGPLFQCLLTQTTQNSVIARHIRAELAEAGIPVLRNEMTNRVIYPEATLWGATPTLIDRKGDAAREIETIADEIDLTLQSRKAAA